MINFIKYKIHKLVSDEKFSEILAGSAWAMSARVLAKGLGMISSIIIARFYGAEVMGIVAVLYSFLTLASIITVLGTQTSILRLIPEHLVKYSPTSAFRVYRKTQFMVIGISLITGTLLFFGSGLIAGRAFSKPHLSFYFALASVFAVFQSQMILNTEAVRGLKLIKTFAFMQALPSLSNLLLLVPLTIMFLRRDNPVYTYLVSLAVTGLLGWMVMEVAFKGKMRPEDEVLTMPASSILSISLPMLMSRTMTFVIGQTGVIMLGMFRTEAEVGYYTIAVKLAMLTSFVLQAINSIIAPKFSELFHSGKMDELFYVAKKATKLVFWTSVPILLGLVLLGKPLLGYFFGWEFAAAYPALVLLVLGQFVNSISGSTAQFMNMTGNQNVFRNTILGAAIVNVSLNLLLIPKLGIIGAATAAMASITFLNITTLLYVKTKFAKTTGYLPLFG
jgi:O-antigen/teichoic acid export membrane protein